MSGELAFGPAPVSASCPQSELDPWLLHNALNAAGVTELYPDFSNWFWSKVVRGLRTGERRIFTSIVDGELAGVAICKRAEIENKLCTLWVSPRARGRGVAAQLANDAFVWLGTRQPLFTVPEERLPEFGGLLRGWSFSGPVAHKELYRPKRTEYVFNSCMVKISH